MLNHWYPNFPEITLCIHASFHYTVSWYQNGLPKPDEEIGNLLWITGAWKHISELVIGYWYPIWSIDMFLLLSNDCTGHKRWSKDTWLRPNEGHFAMYFAHLGQKNKKCNYRKVSNISRQQNCWSLRCSWSIVCRRCSNYIFIINLTPGFNGLGKDNGRTRRETLCFGIGCVLH